MREPQVEERVWSRSTGMELKQEYREEIGSGVQEWNWSRSAGIQLEQGCRNTTGAGVQE